jgi:hypothetical protein
MRTTFAFLFGLLALCGAATPVSALADETSQLPGLSPEAAALDCAGQPFGLTEGRAPGDPANEVFPEIKATHEPEFLPAEVIHDIFVELTGPVLHEKAEQMVQAMTAACTSKRDQTLHVAFYFKDWYSLELKNYGLARKMESYRADFPLVLKARITKQGNFVQIDFDGRRFQTLRLMTKVPLLSDTVYMHRMVVNTDTKWIQIFAGVMKDKIGIAAWSHFESGGPVIAKLSFFRTLGRLFRPKP